MTDEVQTTEGAPAPGANVFLGQNVEAQEPEGEETQAVEAEEHEAESPPAAEPKEESGDSQDISKEANSIQERFNELTRARREAERDKERSERDKERLLALLEARGFDRQGQPKEQEGEKLKTLSDFDYDEGKFAAYLSEQSEKRASEAAKREFEAYQQRMEQDRRRSEFKSREDEYAKDKDDYFEVTRSEGMNRHLSNEMAHTLAGSEIGPEIAYHLGKNPSVLTRLSEMDPYSAARELGRIERNLEIERAKASEKPVSQAPPPAPKIEGQDPGNVEKDPSKMTDAEFAKWRKRQIAARK